MKKIVTSLVLLISICQISFCQKDTVVVYGQRLDTSPFDWRIKHFWNRIKNPINVNENIIKIWSDNGTIDTSYEELFDYYIKPLREGKVNVYCKLRIEKKGKIDTIYTVTRFTSVSQPKIIVLIDDEFLKEKLGIKYTFVYAADKKGVNEARYQLGAFPNPFIVLNSKMEQIGKIYDFSEKNEIKELLKNGKILKVPSFAIRDMQTDLVIWTPEFDYELK